jgi:4-amino-4-deoxy-L-arabinose transferase-like glycosyltransferase
VNPRPGPAPAERPQRWALVALGVILLAGGWLRFAELGKLSFWADEFPHAIAARSLNHTGRPTLPSGREYRRALAQTVAVAGSMRIFGENESAARVPSAVVGLATIAGVWFVARRRFGEGAALGAAAVLAVMPLHIAHSRSARFYAAFALAYGAAAALGTRALEKGSKRAAFGGLAAFAVALHLQIEAAILVLPLFCYALYLWGRAPEHRGSLGRMAAGLAAAGIVAVVVIAVAPPLRHGATWLIDHLPGLELSPGLHLDTLGKVFGVVSWWAWIPAVPAAIAGIRRAGPSGAALLFNLLVPAVLLAILFKPTTARGISARYLFFLVPLVAMLAGIAAADLARRAASLRGRTEGRTALIATGAAMVGVFAVAGVTTVWKIPGEAHPSTIIPRPNWNAATTIVRERGRAGDALLSTSPLAPAWALGRCADWIRETSAAETALEDGRDIYCASELIPDEAAARAYLAGHPRGWLIADPLQWSGIVDPAARAFLERSATRVDVGDRSVLLWRWGS